MEKQEHQDIQNIIEEKAYDENCDEATLEAIKNRAFVYEPRILYIKEIPIQTPFSVKLILDQITILESQFDKWGLIVDLTEAKRPDARSRRVINERFSKLIKNTTHTSFYTKGFLLNTAIRFVMFGLGHKPYSVNSNFEKVLKSVRDSLD